MPWKVLALNCRNHIRRQAALSQSPVNFELLPLKAPIDEELVPGYDPKYFHHPNPGDVLHDRYELKAKIGWGGSSTVWLAEDIRR